MSSSEITTTASRRDVLRGLGGAMAAGLVLPSISPADASSALAKSVARLAVADRGVGLRQATGVFDFARSCGVGGAEIDLGRLGIGPDMPNRLLDPTVRRQFTAAADAAGVSISSLCLSALAGQSFATHARGDAYVNDLLYLMREMSVSVGVLPVDADDDRESLVGRLRHAAAVAERQGSTIALLSPMPAVDLREVLDAVASPAVKAVVVAESDRDAAADFAVLGLSRVAQVRYRHDDEHDRTADLAALGRELAAAGYTGWLVIDRPAVTSDDPRQNLHLAIGHAVQLLDPTFA